MSEFIYLYRSTNEASRAAMGSPEQMQKSMQTWMAWMQQLADKGHIKNPGHPLERTGKLVKGKQRTITDGPYAESKDIIGGYTLVEARDLAEAVELSKGCPILEGGGVVEVRPVLQTGM
ncbi:MAG TPA: YciI family protein [Gemmatimonadales bacterium]|nr:YciI family protein [Gemmatimonadales bacterium]